MLNKSNVINLPSEYQLQKQLPIKILPIVFEYNTGTTLDGDGGATDCDIGKNDSGNDDKLQLLLGEGNMGPVVLPPAKLSNSDAMLDHIRKMIYNGDKVIGAKLEGTMEDYLNIMKERHIAKNRNVDGDEMILISSFDGAKIKHSKKQKCSIISFLSSMFTASMLNTKKVTAGQTSNILTWQQVLAKEDKYIIQQLSKEYFRDWKHLLDGNSECNTSNKIFCYDCHDGKMIYQLLQCSMWNLT